MLGKNIGCVADAMAGLPGGLNIAFEIGNAVSAPGSDLKHNGTLTVVNILPGNEDGAVDRGVLEVINPPANGLDQNPNNGFAIFVKEGIARFDGPVQGVAKWAIAKAASSTVANARLGADEWWVSSRDVDDRYGTNERGRAFDVLIPDTGGTRPQIVTGDVFLYGWVRDDSRNNSFVRALATCHVAYGICNAILSANLVASGATVTVDNVVPLTGANPVDEATDVLTVNNTMRYSGADNDPCRIIYNPTGAVWELLDVRRTIQDVVTDTQVDTINLKLQKKTRDLAGFFDGDESAWTDVHTGTACP